METLLESLKQLDAQELEAIAQQTAILRAQQAVPNLPKAEAALLHKIGQGVVPEEAHRRCAQLSEKAQKSNRSLMHNVPTAEQRQVMNTPHFERLERIVGIYPV